MSSFIFKNIKLGRVYNLCNEVIGFSSNDRPDETPDNVLIVSPCTQYYSEHPYTGMLPRETLGYHCQIECGCASGNSCYWSSRPSTTDDKLEYLTIRLDVAVSLIYGFSITAYEAFYQPQCPIYAPKQVSLQLFALDTRTDELYTFYESATYTVLKDSSEQQFFLLDKPIIAFGGIAKLLLKGMYQRQTIDPSYGSSYNDYYICLSNVSILGVPINNYDCNLTFAETNGIDIRRDHISESYVNNESELFANIESIVRSDLKGYNQIPLWHVHCIHNNGTGSSSLVIRVHHVIGDGISLVGTLLPLFTDIQTGLPIQNDIPSKMRSAESNIPKPSLFAIMKAAFEVLYLAISPYDSNIKFTSPNKSQLVMTPTRKTILLPTLKLEFIKGLKNKANVTVNDILLSCLTGAIVKYCEHFNDPIIHNPSIVNRALLPVAFPRSSDALHDSEEALINKWAFMNCHLALRATNAKDRLLETNKITKHSKFSPNAYVQLWLQTNIMPYMPLFVQKQGAYDLVSRHSLILSNVPGPEQLLSLCNEKLIGVQVIFENLIPQVSSVSYGGLIFTNINIDTDLIVDSEKLLPDYFLQELNELASAYGFHVNENDIVNKVKDDNVFSVDSTIKTLILSGNGSLYGFNNKVLLVGSGGREHAIAIKLSESLSVSKIFVAPGNGGTATAGGKIVNVDIKSEDIKALVEFAKSQHVSLVVVGPEQPLVDGLTDEILSNNIACFGPTAAAAIIEASKAWSKDFMTKYEVNTARYKNFNSYDEAIAHLKSVDYRVVVKASGLAAGKGVILPSTKGEAEEAISYIMKDKAFGSAGAEVVIEEFIEGEEVSLLAFTDGICVKDMPPAQDHKRVFDNDEGPNTGGMGAYAPALVLTPRLRRECLAILNKVISGMAAEGRVYKGVIYGGFMIPKDFNDKRGPSVLEFNARFGDPETQVLLPLLQSDLFDIFVSCVRGTLSDCPVVWKQGQAACTVVCAAPGYPNSYPKDILISGLDDVQNENVLVYHAGTKLVESSIVTNGGRVLSVTGIGESLQSAVSTAYSAIPSISFNGIHYRRDIAKRGITAPIKLGVLGSTRGTDMQAIINAIQSNDLNAKISIVISNKADAGILERANNHNIKNVAISSKGLTREDFDDIISSALVDEGVDLVLLIGYMRILSDKFVNTWSGRCLNVHPSLLPEFAGGMDLQVHEAVIKANKSISGCTIHFVTGDVDGGPIYLQETCFVELDETPESLKAKVQQLEGVAFVKAIKTFQSDLNKGNKTIETITYKAAGVDIDAGDALVKVIGPYCKETRRSGCDAELGGFGGLFDLSQSGYDASDTVLVSGTDGVGTKLKIAQSIGKHDTIGIDLVAMCVNDILVCGAEPLFFLDYYATGSLNVSDAAQVVKGIAEGCKLGGCALIGGETAEMAGMYAKGEYDLAGFSVGAVRRSDILPSNIIKGDLLIALSSSGVHSNGYSLVRKCVEKSGLQWTDQAPYITDQTISLGESLLTPTRIYVSTLLPLIKLGLIKGMAHITGGGLLDNLPRVLPNDLAAFIDLQSSGWSLPPVFEWLNSIANLNKSELFRTFNCGIGMVLVIDPNNLQTIQTKFNELNEKYYVIGDLRERENRSEQVVLL
eukprot:gene19941-25907_t